MHSPDTHRTDWDAVYAEHGPGGHRKELHRGLALSLPDDVHAQVHDDSRPVAERAHLLLDHIQSRPGGMGRFWTGGEGVGRAYAMGAVRDEDRQNRSYQSTPVVVHAHVPERQHIETDPDKLFAQHTMSYHLDSQREVPLKPGTSMHVKGISWHAPKPDFEVRRPEGQLADLRADKPYYDDPSSDDHLWTRHNFEGGMKSTASRFCENCGAKSSPYFPRKNVNGQMWCPMCVQNRRSASVKMHPVRSRSSAQEDAMPKLNTLNSLPLTALLPDGRIAIALRVGNGRICKNAHDSGDGETIFHCPMCGSGQVIARNDGSVECEFCSCCFTVQIQPQMPAFPQTIDGQPVDVPGMPNGGRDANVPPGTAPVGGDDPMDPDVDPSDPDAAQVPPGEDGDPQDADDDGGDDKPAFLKGSALLYRTASGRVLNETQYVRHLAITHANDPAKVLAKIRAENTRG